MKKVFASLVLLVIIMGLVNRPVRADMAPPYMPPGSNLVPGAEITQVRMMAETVVLTVFKHPGNTEFTDARTVATFTMRNLGSEEEKMKARFPLRTDATICFDDYCPEITDLVIMVDGAVIKTERQMLPFTYTPYKVRNTPWAVFDVTFPPAKDVIVEVSYTADAYGYYPFQAFDYILETGAGWKDTIGSADIIVRFPYEVNNYNIWLEEEPGGGFGQTSDGGILSGKEIRWHFDDLEPTWKDNFHILLIAPNLWESILRDSEIVAEYPKDGEAWGRLGKAYKEVAHTNGYLRHDAAGLEMFQLSREAYEKCLTLLPNDSLWHVGYADLLWVKYFDNRSTKNLPDSEGILPIVLLHLQTALEIDPTNEKARDLLIEIDYFVPDAVQVDGKNFIFLGLTATPLPPTSWAYPSATASPTLTAIASPITTLEPSLQEEIPEPIKTPVSNPLCGSSALIIPALVVALWDRRRRN